MAQTFSVWFDRLLLSLAVVAAGLIAMIAVAIIANLILRNLKLPVIYGTLDAVEYAIMIATFMGAPWVLNKRAHVQVDLVFANLSFPNQLLLGRLNALLGAAICVCFSWFGVEAMLESLNRGSMVRTSFVIPEWWTLVIVPFSMGLCAIEFTRHSLNTNPSELTGSEL